MFRRMQHDIRVRGVTRRLEQGIVHGFEKRLGLDSLPVCKDKGFAKRMNHGTDEKIAGQLHAMRLSRLFTDDGYSSRKSSEQRAGTVQGLVGTGCHDPQLP